MNIHYGNICNISKQVIKNKIEIKLNTFYKITYTRGYTEWALTSKG